MNNVGFVLLYILFHVFPMIINNASAVHVKYFRQPSTWFEAQTKCQHAGGRLATYKESTLTCDKIEGDVDSAKGSTFWTGEYTKSYWISREGCYNITRTTDVSWLSLSECFALCRKQNISLHRFAYRLRDQKCVCLHNNALMTLHESHNCSEFIKLKKAYFSYEVVALNQSKDSCAYFDCEQNQTFPSSCKDKRVAFCGDSTSSLYWNMFQEKCRNIVLENLNTTCKMHYDVGYRGGIWLPIQKLTIRTEIIGHEIYNEKDVSECTYYHCYNKQKVHPMHVNTTCKSMTDGFFCAFAKNTDYLDQAVTPHTGIIIGGVIGTTVLIVVIVLIIVYKFRCKNALSKKANDRLFGFSNGQSPTYKEDHNTETSSTNSKMYNNKLYDEQCLPPCKIVPDESLRNEKDNREDCSRPNDVYSTPMKTKNVEQFTQEEDSKDGIDVESEYDILNKTPRSSNDTLEHNIYDTTIASRCESDPTYNTATNSMSKRKNDDDMYDRL
ncbi:uncharacterized protein LOC143055379 [Mytilus galloprovincialis]|uniref:uncharacterized protein LOC143055379 n=1 Tax=Mytilus galloprovincialis TaxID=29158 RepID=UPI003F7CBD7A